MKDFMIKNATLLEMDFLLLLAKQEKWNPGLHDAFPFYQTDPHGFFIGEINQEKIGGISAVAYNDKYGFMGFYVVIPSYRRQGFGFQLWNHALNYLGNRCIGLDGVVEQQENYKKSLFQWHHKNIRFQGKGIKHATSALLDLTQIPIKQVLEYDEKVFGMPRKNFLIPWLQMPNAISLASCKNGNLEGYGTIRKCFEGYKIGPLFADTFEIAKKIYLGLCSKAHGASVFLDVPETNEAGMSLVKLFKLEKVFETARMYTKSPPKLQLDKTFGITSLELG